MSNWLGLREDQRLGERVASLLMLELNRIAAPIQARSSASASAQLCLFRPHDRQALCPPEHAKKH